MSHRKRMFWGIQINDVDIDHRGLAYASDRVGTGLFILEYAGAKRRQGTN